jgi:RNA polymerase sigma-70 factor (ECF subfamily)
MTAKTRPDEGSPSEGTLGYLLYADRTRPRVPEAEWVALVHAVAVRDPAALRALYDRAHRLVFTLALRIGGSRETADEVTVDTFHEIWRRAPAYDPKIGTVIAWIMNQARSRAIDRLRFDQRQKRVDPFPHAVEEAPFADASELQELAELGDQLRGALGVLTKDEREAIQAAYFSQMSYAETATHLKQPLGTIKTRIRSGLAKLREVLRPGAAPK